MKNLWHYNSVIIISLFTAFSVQAGSIADEYTDGQLLDATTMNGIRNAVNDNNSRVGTIESQTQNLVTGCPAGQSIRAIAADGSLTCEVDDSTTGTDTLSELGCADGEVAKSDGAGSWACEIDNVKTSGVLGTIASSGINITSTTHTEIASLSITDSGIVNVALNAHFSVEITGFSLGRLQAEIRNTSCSGTTLGQAMWRPGNSDAATNSALNAATISLTGFQSVIAPGSFVLCVRKFDTTFPDALIFYRGFNLTYSN